jgi:hypothetical protein
MHRDQLNPFDFCHADDVEVLNEQLQAAELQIEDLKQQLDGAMGAEDMLEQLTERTLNMGEVCSDSITSHPHMFMH